jgi:hypothetical protein
MHLTFVVLCTYLVTELYYYRLQEHELDARQLAVVAVRTDFMTLMTILHSIYIEYIVAFS